MDKSTLQPGALIPAFVREGTFDHWNRFAGVNDEYAGHHMDDEVGRYEGFASAFGMAPLIIAYLQTMLREWIGAEDGRVVSVGIQLRSPFLRGRTLTAQGRVTEVTEEDGETLVALEIWADDSEGVRLVGGAAKVAVPS